jgi:hypothetical protein
MIIANRLMGQSRHVAVKSPSSRLRGFGVFIFILIRDLYDVFTGWRAIRFLEFFGGISLYPRTAVIACTNSAPPVRTSVIL